MKKWIYTLLSFLTLMQATCAYSVTKKFEIRFPLYEDGRDWKKGGYEEDQLISLTEYHLPSESTDNWSELVTTQYFASRYDFSLEDYFGNAVRELAKAHPRNKVQSTVLESCENSLTAMWWIRDRSPDDQYEWVKIFKNNNHVGILRYTTRRMDQATTRGKVWEHIMSLATFE